MQMKREREKEKSDILVKYYYLILIFQTSTFYSWFITIQIQLPFSTLSLLELKAVLNI